MKTRPHSVRAARAEAEARQAAASDLHLAHSPEWHAEVALRELQAVTEHGLWSCYADLEEYMSDFWPDLPWDDAGLARAARLIVEDLRFEPVRAALEAEWGLNIGPELKSALTDPEAGAEAASNRHRPAPG